jgi:hypothetical protein
VDHLLQKYLLLIFRAVQGWECGLVVECSASRYRPRVQSRERERETEKERERLF